MGPRAGRILWNEFLDSYEHAAPVMLMNMDRWPPRLMVFADSISLMGIEDTRSDRERVAAFLREWADAVADVSDLKEACGL